jgi:hypothetical protein
MDPQFRVRTSAESSRLDYTDKGTLVFATGEAVPAVAQPSIFQDGLPG